ncbi:hypothetical protein LXA43DRAFT_1064505 [Ganoderma leucocontextum]|nr:hypothetical protein LXA43DRAFT_1064505 [Ganoderma leucocontextum]
MRSPALALSILAAALSAGAMVSKPDSAAPGAAPQDLPRKDTAPMHASAAAPDASGANIWLARDAAGAHNVPVDRRAQPQAEEVEVRKRQDDAGAVDADPVIPAVETDTSVPDDDTPAAVEGDAADSATDTPEAVEVATDTPRAAAVPVTAREPQTGAEDVDGSSARGGHADRVLGRSRGANGGRGGRGRGKGRGGA